MSTNITRADVFLAHTPMDDLLDFEPENHAQIERRLWLGKNFKKSRMGGYGSRENALANAPTDADIVYVIEDYWADGVQLWRWLAIQPIPTQIEGVDRVYDEAGERVLSVHDAYSIDEYRKYPRNDVMTITIGEGWELVEVKNHRPEDGGKTVIVRKKSN